MQQRHGSKQVRRLDGAEELGQVRATLRTQIAELGQQSDGGQQRQNDAAVMLHRLADLQQATRQRIDETGGHHIAAEQKYRSVG